MYKLLERRQLYYYVNSFHSKYKPTSALPVKSGGCCHQFGLSIHLSAIRKLLQVEFELSVQLRLSGKVISLSLSEVGEMRILETFHSPLCFTCEKAEVHRVAEVLSSSFQQNEPPAFLCG